MCIGRHSWILDLGKQYTVLHSVTNSDIYLYHINKGVKSEHVINHLNRYISTKAYEPKCNK